VREFDLGALRGIGTQCADIAFLLHPDKRFVGAPIGKPPRNLATCSYRLVRHQLQRRHLVLCWTRIFHGPDRAQATLYSQVRTTDKTLFDM
jgi:hypothetical protein